MRREMLTHQWHPRLAGTPRPTVDGTTNSQTMAPQRNSPRRTHPHGKSFHQRVLGSFGLDANHQNGKLGQRLVGVALFLQDFVELEDFLRLLDDSFSADRDFRVEIFLPHHDSPVSFVSVTILASALCSASLTRQKPRCSALESASCLERIAKSLPHAKTPGRDVPKLSPELAAISRNGC